MECPCRKWAQSLIQPEMVLTASVARSTTCLSEGRRRPGPSLRNPPTHAMVRAGISALHAWIARRSHGNARTHRYRCSCHGTIPALPRLRFSTAVPAGSVVRDVWGQFHSLREMRPDSLRSICVHADSESRISETADRMGSTPQNAGLHVARDDDESSSALPCGHLQTLRRGSRICVSLGLTGGSQGVARRCAFASVRFGPELGVHVAVLLLVHLASGFEQDLAIQYNPGACQCPDRPTRAHHEGRARGYYEATCKRSRWMLAARRRDGEKLT
ncbi:uncharacterized protein C8Q71DRAFT_745767 [Rhodofomes roseus]|uniref:Uncharacterized protein n=1 Tax=Rhodofomes roseus TaxID=34475 RepID=A0ABQ8KNT9_9APHY|nr:uncharacterized protein C8Q71DRAFT_745767 [Rhodofomes roseus]KAH9840093.1 hypothetical protein C8Q71DRAFT_745767 [Rhodofomes roseus]